MVDAVAAAEAYLHAHRTHTKSLVAPELSDDALRALLLRLRGRLSATVPRVLVVDERLREVADRPDLSAVVTAGVASADHMLWTGPWSCAVTTPTDLNAAVAAVDSAERDYVAYFKRHSTGDAAAPIMHDPLPKVLLVPGVGALVAGEPADARRRADVALHTHTVAAQGLDAFGSVEPLDDDAVFDWDYWPQEQAKLQEELRAGRLGGRVFVVTGAASGIGRTIVRHLCEQGANLAIADLDSEGLDAVVAEARPRRSLRPGADRRGSGGRSGGEGNRTDSRSPIWRPRWRRDQLRYRRDGSPRRVDAERLAPCS